MLIVCGVICSFGGCKGKSDGRPSAQISGRVTLDGKPLSEGSIQFTSSKTGESAYSNLSDEGSYSIFFPSVDIGAEYAVTLGPPVNDLEEQEAQAIKPLRLMFPRKYTRRTSSGLTAKIEKLGDNEFSFDLKSK